MKKFLAVLLTVLVTFGAVSMTASAIITDDLDFQPVATMCLSAGDIDYDGFVTPADARFALRYAIGLETDATLAEFGEQAVARGDIDAEAGITVNDARSILRISIRLDPQPGHQAEEKIVAPKWTAAGAKCSVCALCDAQLTEAELIPSKIDAMLADANAFAEEKGVSNLVKGVSENDGAKLALEINVDAIWEGLTVEGGAFDGLLTKLGAYVNENLADAVITLDGSAVYDSKLLNTPVKNAIFSVFSGFFYKIATTKDGVYGAYALTVDGEDVALTVKMTGKEENIAKIRSFAQVIADHVWADATGTDLVIGLQMPDALMNTVNEKGGLDKVNATTVGACLTALQAVELENVLGSQQSAVNKLCATVCGLDAFVNKVLGKVTSATVTVDGKEVELLSGAAFAPAAADYYGLLEAVVDMLSDDLKAVTVGSFLQEDGAYKVPVNVTVDVSNADVMTNGVISETIYFVIAP